jgi:hypothetical protein
MLHVDLLVLHRKYVPRPSSKSSPRLFIASAMPPSAATLYSSITFLIRTVIEECEVVHVILTQVHSSHSLCDVIDRI